MYVTMVLMDIRESVSHNVPHQPMMSMPTMKQQHVHQPCNVPTTLMQTQF